MNSITVYIDEFLSTREMLKLKHELMSMPNVVGVEFPRNDHHDITIDFKERNGLPTQILGMIRGKGLHPDIISG